MKALDRFLQRWRIAKVRPFIPWGARVLDIGCGDGTLFRICGKQIGQGIGLDPTLPTGIKEEHFELIPVRFPEALPDTEPFDVITMLAILEHIPEAEQRSFAKACALNLKPGGWLLITTPSPLVDHILSWLQAFRLIDGMSLEEHHGFDPRQTPAIFSGCELKLVKAAKFQLGLNNFFIFKKSVGPTLLTDADNNLLDQKKRRSEFNAPSYIKTWKLNLDRFSQRNPFWSRLRTYW